MLKPILLKTKACLGLAAAALLSVPAYADDIGDDIMTLPEVAAVLEEISNLQHCLVDDTIPVVNPWLTCTAPIQNQTALYFLEADPETETFWGCNEGYDTCLADVQRLAKTLDEYLKDLQEICKEVNCNSGADDTEPQDAIAEVAEAA